MKVFGYGASNPESVAQFRENPNVELVAFIDDARSGGYFEGYPVIPLYKVPQFWEKLELGNQVPLAVNLVCGSTKARRSVALRCEEARLSLVSLIHPTAVVRPYHLDCYIQDRVVIQEGCEVGENISIHMGSLIGHETKIGPHAFIAHGVSVCGRCEIGEGAYIGAGAVLLPGVKIGEWSTVGAGAVVTKDVPAGEMWAGNPARALRKGA